MIILFFFSIFVGPKFLKFEFMPKQDEGKYALTAELQNGTDLAKAERIAKELEEIIKSDPHTQSYLMLVSTSRISINANVGKKNTRDESVFTIMDDIRNKASKVLDARISMTNQFSGGQSQKDVEFLLQGSNQDEIKNLVNNY